MKSFRVAAILALLAMPSTLLAGSSTDPAECSVAEYLHKTLAGAAIVQATVIDVETTSGGLRTAVYSVEKVLFGDATAQGVTLRFPIYKYGSMNAMMMDPEVAKGDDGVYIVRKPKGRHFGFDTDAMTTLSFLGLPARRNVPKEDFDGAVRLAADMLSVSRASGEDKTAKLQELLKSKNRLSAAWARNQLDTKSPCYTLWLKPGATVSTGIIPADDPRMKDAGPL